jgi:hypothetical protein
MSGVKDTDSGSTALRLVPGNYAAQKRSAIRVVQFPKYLSDPQLGSWVHVWSGTQVALVTASDYIPLRL